MTTALGLGSGALTTASFVPQVVRAARTGRSADLSWVWLLMLLVGFVGWLSYGLLTTNLSIIVTNSVTLVLAGALVAIKVRHHLAMTR
ncbi:MAG TPA: SemiSWEET family transporter [Streptosporangiaceae bacterium]|nr:SemiSWEET family transporter [Streptosporangiaceae bacterium]